MFMWKGEIVELDTTEVIFGEKPKDQRTRDYVEAIFG